MTRDQLDRMIPHHGDFGMSSWVDCKAPCCAEVQGNGPGWFVIVAGEPHFFDPTTHAHVHAACYVVMQARVKASEAA